MLFLAMITAGIWTRLWKVSLLAADLPELTLIPSDLLGLRCESCPEAIRNRSVLWTFRQGRNYSICSSRKCHVSQKHISNTLFSFAHRRKTSLESPKVTCCAGLVSFWLSLIQWLTSLQEPTVILQLYLHIHIQVISVSPVLPPMRAAARQPC